MKGRERQERLGEQYWLLHDLITTRHRKECQLAHQLYLAELAAIEAERDNQRRGVEQSVSSLGS